ncbi:hypothetical protein AAF712_001860 [Marasmius tenuissimus]|uniref:Ricin B lectin domain-containing protein n=1 Tax=Marasmius tenuissimus TaxID=585030 RepID=A0ABR3AD10_9AGAR|nr:hypothetical protein PM082_007985 [Marasmius tenuissimus]
MPIENGEYEITSSGYTIARSVTEDRSLNPKRILSLPKGLEAQEWTVERVDDDKYLLKAGGAPTGEHEGHVYAFLIDQDKAEQWILEPVQSSHPNCFIILTKDRKKGWIVQEGSTRDDLKQVKCEELLGSDGDYSPQEIFQFSPVA